MRKTHLALAAFAGALLGLLAAPSAAAARTRLDGIPAEVHGGEYLDIRWSGLDADVHEVELELSLGGTRWVRISPEMEALEGRFRWRVPESLAGPARIRLRAGGEEGEREVAEQSVCFVPTSDAGPGIALDTPGWWELEPVGRPAPQGHFGSRHSALTPGGEFEQAVSASSSDSERTAAVERTSACRAPASPSSRVRARAFAAPRQVPLRN